MAHKFKVGDTIRATEDTGIQDQDRVRVRDGYYLTIKWIEYDDEWGDEFDFSFDSTGTWFGCDAWFELVEEKSIDDMLVEKYGINIEKGKIKTNNGHTGWNIEVLLSRGKEGLEEAVAVTLWAYNNYEYLEKMFGGKK